MADLINFLENLAQTANCFEKNQLESLLKHHNINVKQAFAKNDSNLLKNEISTKQAFPHESHVIQALIYDLKSQCL